MVALPRPSPSWPLNFFAHRRVASTATARNSDGPTASTAAGIDCTHSAGGVSAAVALAGKGHEARKSSNRVTTRINEPGDGPLCLDIHQQS